MLSDKNFWGMSWAHEDGCNLFQSIFDNRLSPPSIFKNYYRLIFMFTQHKNVDVEHSELPVGAIHAEHKPDLDRKQRENHTGYDVVVKNILGEESPEPSKVGIHVDCRRHRINQLMEADSLHHAEDMDKQRHKFNVCKIHIFSKMLLHNREDLVNFDRVLGISNFS